MPRDPFVNRPQRKDASFNFTLPGNLRNQRESTSGPAGGGGGVRVKRALPWLGTNLGINLAVAN